MSPDPGAPHDPVARNRATPARRTPGRPQLGHETLRRVMLVAGGAVVVATLVLLVLLATA